MIEQTWVGGFMNFIKVRKGQGRKQKVLTVAFGHRLSLYGCTLEILVGCRKKWFIRKLRLLSWKSLRYYFVFCIFLIRNVSWGIYIPGHTCAMLLIEPGYSNTSSFWGRGSNRVNVVIIRLVSVFSSFSPSVSQNTVVKKHDINCAVFRLVSVSSGSP